MAKTEFGQELSSASANSVYLLKTEDDKITAVLSLEEGVDVNKYVSDLQEYLYEIADTSGIVGQGDPARKDYTSTNYIADGDSRKLAIEKLDTQAFVNATGIANNLILINQNADNIQDIIDSIAVASGAAPIGVGICPLDANAKIPTIHLPDVLLQYLGVWDADTNTPTISDATGNLNEWYRVNVAGTQDLGSGPISFNVGDKVVHNGTIWQRWDTTDEVISVNGKTGAVILDKNDIGLGNVTNDAQMLRAANDYLAFVEKVTPVNDDLVIIEDSEDSGNKKRLRLENMIGGGGVGFQETPTGVVNGINTDFTISLTPTNEDSILPIVNGTILKKSEWSYVHPVITLATAPVIGQDIYVFYLTDGTVTPPVTSPGTENVNYIDITALMITNKELTLPATPAIATNTVVDVIGGTSQRYGSDFTVSGNVLSWNGLGLETELIAGDVLRIRYLS